MSGRDLDPERIRRGHFDRLDSSTADRVMNREFRSAERRDRSTTAVRMYEASEHQVEQTRRELAQSRIIPAALTLACEHAPAGERCYVNGICGDRAARGVLAKYAALG
ncbi:hypothetical protein [Microbacterium lacticum]|uniref:hypothetical protein n=1 Tax=Microbacterium lacticum TaxID=33885 RepID=UPI0028D2C4D9|nr:hypothetical protein [Microbacterium lacticum]